MPNHYGALPRSMLFGLQRVRRRRTIMGFGIFELLVILLILGVAVVVGVEVLRIIRDRRD